MPRGTNIKAGKGQILDRSATNQRLYKYWAEDYIAGQVIQAI